LVLTLGFYRPAPQGFTDACFKFKQTAGEQRVRATIGREHKAHGFERFADDKRDAMLGGFEEKVTVNGSAKTGDDDGGHVFQRELSLAFFSAAG
jgi:hypothetical protein